MFDPSKPVQTRGGQPARIIATDVKGDAGNILALVTDETGEDPRVYYSNGRYLGSGEEAAVDLVNVPRRIIRHFNMGHAYTNREAAEKVVPGWAVIEVIMDEDGAVISAERVSEGEDDLV